MKKLICLAACAVAACSALTGCDMKDGRINDGKNHNVFDTESRVTVSSENRTTSRVVVRGTDTDRGVLHDTASMIGDVGEDIAEGAENIGSSIVSNVSDATHNDNM